MLITGYRQDYETQVVELWNRVLWADPITVGKFRKQALFDDNFDSTLCTLALDKDRVGGLILATKRKFPYMERGLEPDRGWINVLSIDEPFQRKGTGAQLLLDAEKKLAELGVKQITLGAYSPNYFFPGLDCINYPGAKAFFDKHGYRAGEAAYSMRKDLHGFRLSEEALAKKKATKKKGYSFINFNYSYALDLLEFAKSEFGGGWKRNVLLNMQNNLAEDCILLALNGAGKIAGFCMRMIDGNPLRFGPIGIAESERNAGLGGILFDFMQAEMAKRGLYSLFFLSTDEPGRRFYERHGLTVFRTFTDYWKDL
ncbi:MAG: GNAT family N-acetyltransferase [Treponema sp.]|jgi:ribosomal protein S18 acetylase RimI-like enzyme|nr:GNAT family N-acetyltransferase [Treponema sp.]